MSHGYFVPAKCSSCGSSLDTGTPLTCSRDWRADSRTENVGKAHFSISKPWRCSGAVATLTPEKTSKPAPPIKRCSIMLLRS